MHFQHKTWPANVQSYDGEDAEEEELIVFRDASADKLFLLQWIAPHSHL